MKTLWLTLAVLILGPAATSAQPVFAGHEIFPASEFAARRARVIEQIGTGVAIIQGTTERPGEQPFRQNNQFFYLCGVAEPRAILLIDARARTATAFLQPRNERREQRAFGPGLYPGPEAASATGLDAVRDRAEFAAVLAAVAAEGRPIHTPFRPEVLGQASSSDPAAMWRATKADPWDGRISREDAFVAKLKAAAPSSELKDLDPVIDGLRLIKSPREIDIIRAATRISGLAIMEAMRDAQPGMFEYELQASAEFVFKRLGAYGPSYFALIATGTNTYYTHYHKATARLHDGDLVQIDYGPDYKYYQGDVTRVFPASGRFTPRQREHYGIALALYRALLTSIRPRASAQEVIRDAVVKMDAAMAAFPFTDPAIKAAASAYVERYRASKATSLGHHVGMAVHDVRGPNPPASLEPGMVFTIEPALLLDDERLGIRLEDMLLVTESGIENLSAFVPIEMDAIESLMAQKGLSEYRLK
ncbi:MAG: aminopeptidase P N-terminal domain-containing protein [Vicinamibacterales bacterium]